MIFLFNRPHKARKKQADISCTLTHTDWKEHRVTNTDTHTSSQTQRVFLSPAPWCRWIPLAADAESTLGHYNNQRGPTQARKVEGAEKLGRRTTLLPCGETTLTQSSVLVTQELDHTDTHTEQPAISAALLWYCIKGTNRVHLKNIENLTRRKRGLAKCNGWQMYKGGWGFVGKGAARLDIL